MTSTARSTELFKTKQWRGKVGWPRCSGSGEFDVTNPSQKKSGASLKNAGACAVLASTALSP